MSETSRKEVKTRKPIEQGQPHEFIANFGEILEENGLTHKYYSDDSGASMMLTKANRFTRHDILKEAQSKVLGINMGTKLVTIAHIVSESRRDPGPSIHSELVHNGLIIEVIDPKDMDVMRKVVDSIHQIYPDEPISLGRGN